MPKNRTPIDVTPFPRHVKTMSDELQHQPPQSRHGTTKTPKQGIVLWPHRSLSPRGFKILMLVLAGLMFCIGLGFFLAGAWPVIGFLGLEIFVVWLAFRMNFRAARQRETLRADPQTFSIERTDPSGSTEIEEMPTAWLQARLVEDSERAHTETEKLVVRSHGKEAEIGAFLHQSEKKQLLPEINAMLDKVRQ